jgi:hypothetical protein
MGRSNCTVSSFSPPVCEAGRLSVAKEKHAHIKLDLLNARALKTTSDPLFVEVERWPVR